MRSIKKLIVPSKIVDRVIHVTSPIADNFKSIYVFKMIFILK